MSQGLPTGLSNVKHSKEEAAALVGQTSSKPGRLSCACILDTRAIFCGSPGSFLQRYFGVQPFLVCFARPGVYGITFLASGFLW